MKPHYDPRSRSVYLPAGCSIQATAHEFAHADQHREDSRAFRAWQAGGWIAWHYCATIWVEFDAYRRTRRQLLDRGLWSRAAKVEARQNLLSYVTRHEINVVRSL